MGVLGGADNNFVYAKVIFALALLFLLPTALTIYTGIDGNVDDTVNEMTEGYRDFTGAVPTEEAVWGLTGIYTPYSGGDHYGHTEDGWLYQDIVGPEGSTGYTPSQYAGSEDMRYSVAKDAGGLYHYLGDTKNGNFKTGDLYTSVTMDYKQKSNIFFTESGKTEQDNGFFYYNYTGYRYAFQPLADYQARNADNQAVDVTATTTSLSLIWYDYYGSEGISGQLVLTGSDTGVAYLTAAEIVRSFDSITSTSKFTMTFNGIDMNIYIKLNPYYISQGLDVKQCFNQGYWSIMVSSMSTATDAYVGTDFTFNPADIFNTMIDLFTFNATDLGLSGWTATIASLLFTVPLYAALLSIGMSFYPVLIMAGILAAIQGFTHFL